jgi:hypothetical protein
MQIGHRFATFLVTLYREVQKRSVLQSGQSEPALDETPLPGVDIA